MKQNIRACILHTEISSNRISLFQKLSEKLDVTIYFGCSKSKKRMWNTEPHTGSFKYKELSHFFIGPMIINYLLYKEFNFKDYDVFIIDDDPRLAFTKLFITLKAKMLGASVIIWSGHVSRGYYGRLNQVINYIFLSTIRQLVYNKADHFIAYGKETVKYLENLDILRTKISAGTQAVPDDNFSEIPIQTKSEIKSQLALPNKKCILYLGYLRKRKGINHLINSFCSLNRDDSILVIAGEGEYSPALKSLAANNANILFPGYVSGETKVAYYSAADLFVFPTLNDPWGLVINEAMLAGLPVITTSAAGASELVDGNGIIIAPGDEESLTRAITFLLDNPDKREKMGARSKEIIDQYTVDWASDTFVSALSKVVNDSK